ncbi:uncharacterized protein LOC107486466 [Arachis duranensis]|uniref:Uncharacterized protein LOC107486466 n=1 Tax=Arachis duranensis TaxID=130453 RepID=A0A6P4D570_ARADU|nr:uncharacterized protein LOC107486466 [Arachis duranensis]
MGGEVIHLYYKIMISILRDDVKYDSFVIGNDEDLQVLFHYHRQFSEVRTLSYWPSLWIWSLVQEVLTGILSLQPWQPALVRGLLGGAPNGVEDVFQDEDGDDVEPAAIADDSDDELAMSTPTGGGGATISGTLQFGARFTQVTRRQAEFQVVQQFQDKKEVVLSVKTYSIRCGIEYKVLESDYRKYHGKCKKFGNSDHRRLDYQVISAFILPMIRADVTVSIKRVWMAKQKVVVQIYEDWEKSYNELLRWVLGVQMTMLDSFAVLRTSPVRLDGQVDKSHAYFHHLFWTFPLCIKAFRRCKPLVSVNGTHLYDKYGGTLLVAIAQDGNSNIIHDAFALLECENAELRSLIHENLMYFSWVFLR